MVQRDYILRMIEAMALVVQRIREMVLGGRTSVAAGEIAEEAERAGLDLGLARTMDGETLLALLMPRGSSVDPTRAMLYGEILYLDGLLARAEARHEDAHVLFAKALLLLRTVGLHSRTIGVRFTQLDERVDELTRLLDEPDPT